MEKFFVKLERFPTVQLSCSFLPNPKPKLQDSLIVFLNGIGNPHTLWYRTATILNKENPSCPPMLMYDRVGQGASIGHNPDVSGRPKGHGRDCLDAAYDLREVITCVGKTCLGISPDRLDSLRIIFVASSVACAIARLYAAEFPETVMAFVFLDSTLANSDTISLFPDTESPGFSPANLPAGVTPELCLDARKKFFPIYGSESENPEGLWRGNLPNLLPYADLPKLQGPKPGTPYVTVIRHDPEIFSPGVKKALGVDEIMTKTYVEPAWHQYHQGLARLTMPNLSKGPLIPKGCRHLIHKDNPEFVAGEVLEIIQKLSQDKQSRL